MAWLQVCGLVLVALGVLSAFITTVATRLVLRAPSPPEPKEWPPVSILKPLKGVDPGLEENLESFLALDYPNYEIILGTAEADDPAFAIALKIANKAQVRVEVLADPTMIGCNPKVNNLANLHPKAHHELILISDSNVRVRPDYLKNLVAHREQAGGGLAWSVFRGIGWKGFFGGLEALQVNGMVLGGMCGIHKFLRLPCALGKSMLLGKKDLEAIGGWSALADYLAEDQVIAEEVKKTGAPVVLANAAVDNILGPRTLAGFSGRHLRWCRLRRHLNLAAYLGEFFVNPVFLSLVLLALVRTPRVALLSALTLLSVSMLDFFGESFLGVRRSVLAYPVAELAFSILRGVLWFVPFFSNVVVWRGNRLHLGKRSRITLETPLYIRELDRESILKP